MTLPTDQLHKQEAPKSVDALVITVSDTRTVDTDGSGSLIRNLLDSNGHSVIGYFIVRDEPEEISTLLDRSLQRSDVQVIILNGGTGISCRDSTYEVICRYLAKTIDGFGELFRYLSYQEIGAAAMMSRAVAGVADDKVIISLPGSENAVRLAMNRLVLPEITHMVAMVCK